MADNAPAPAKTFLQVLDEIMQLEGEIQVSFEGISKDKPAADATAQIQVFFPGLTLKYVMAAPTQVQVLRDFAHMFTKVLMDMTPQAQ